jgi:endonuclease/exonuclease/phosphatase family metal-dependent hydrolase
MAQTLRIATFNLESLDDRPDVDPPLCERIAVLRPQLLRLEADVLCLQEVNGQRPPGGGPRRLLALDGLLEGTPYTGFERVSTARVSGRGPGAGPAPQGVESVHNLVILSRFPIVESRDLYHELVAPASYRPSTADPPASEAQPIVWDRPVLHAAVALPGGSRLHIVNLHLRAPLAAPVMGQKSDPATWKSVAGWAEGFFLATVKRAGQALEARLMVERLFDAEPEALVAVTGDFNAEERQMPLRTIRGDVEDTGNPRLATRMLIPLERTLPESRRYSVLHGGRKEMLDHMLVSRALLARYRHVEIHNEGLVDELSEGGPESHHAPVVAEFEGPDS